MILYLCVSFYCRNFNVNYDNVISCRLLLIVFFLLCLGDGRWRQVIRRCASVADTGVTGVCNWGVYENGVYWEECYCAHEACNSAETINQSWRLVAAALVLAAVLAKQLIR